MTEDPYVAPDAPLTSPGTVQLWNPNAIGLWSLLLTPAWGSVLILLNWRARGDGGWVKVSVLWLVASLVAVAVSGLRYPLLYPIWLLAWWFAFASIQFRTVRRAHANDYPRRGWLVPLVLGVLFRVGLQVGLIATHG